MRRPSWCSPLVDRRRHERLRIGRRFDVSNYTRRNADYARDAHAGARDAPDAPADHYSRSCHDNSRHCHAKIGYSQDHDHDRQKSNHAQCCAVLVTVNLASTLTAIGLGRRSRGQKGDDRKN